MTPAKRVHRLLAAATLALMGALALGEAAQGGTHSMGTLDVRVANVKDARGQVHVDICTADEFLKDCHISVEAPATAGVTVVTVHDLPPGVYAAQAYHDVNSNQRVDRDVLGIPKEGVGFSNDPRLLFKAPKFASASFSFDGQPTSIEVPLHYFAH